MGTILGFLLFLCSAFQTVFALPTRGLNNSSEKFVPCEDGWYFFGEMCYKIGGYGNEAPLTWEEAALVCAEMGGHLASIHSKEQNDFFNIFLALNMKQIVWIGLSDSQRESTFKWEDGSPVDYQNWADRQPDNFNNEEDCVEFLSEPHLEIAGKWNDLPCDRKTGYVCQKASNKELKSPDPRFCSVEDGGGWKFRDSCLTFVNEKKSWEDAEQYCQNTFNGHLAMILSEAYDEILQYVLPNNKSHIWIGIKKQDRFQQMWTTKWPVSYGHFDESLEEMESGSCILRWNQNMWTSEPCDEEHRFLCQKVDPPALRKTAQKSRCPDFPNNWRDLGGEFCYFIEANRKITWHKAQEECLNRGGILATIHSKEEEEVLHPLIKQLSLVSIGLNNLLTNGEIYAWSDGSQLNYTHWAPNEPNSKSEMCVQIRTRDMSWNDISCTFNAAFMCQVKKVPEKLISENENEGEEDIKETDEFTDFPAITSDERISNESNTNTTVSSLVTIEERISNESKTDIMVSSLPTIEERISNESKTYIMESSPATNEDRISNESRTDTAVSSPTTNEETASNKLKMDTSGDVSYKLLYEMTVSILFFMILFCIILLVRVFYYFGLRMEKRRKKSAHSFIPLQPSHEETFPEKHVSHLNEGRSQVIENGYEFIN